MARNSAVRWSCSGSYRQAGRRGIDFARALVAEEGAPAPVVSAAMWGLRQKNHGIPAQLAGAMWK